MSNPAGQTGAAHRLSPLLRPGGAARFAQDFNMPSSEQMKQYLWRGNHKRMLPKVK